LTSLERIVFGGEAILMAMDSLKQLGKWFANPRIREG